MPDEGNTDKESVIYMAEIMLGWVWPTKDWVQVIELSLLVNMKACRINKIRVRGVLALLDAQD